MTEIHIRTAVVDNTADAGFGKPLNARLAAIARQSGPETHPGVAVNAERWKYTGAAIACRNGRTDWWTFALPGGAMMNTTRPQHLFPCPRTQSGTLWRIGLTAALLCTLGARTADAQKRGNALTLPQIAEDGGLSPRQPVLQGEAPTLVAVFATWCGYCGHEVPMLNRLQRQLADRGGRVVGISVDTGSPTEVGRWMRRYRVDYPVFQSDRRIRSGRSFMGNPSALPLTLLVSERGQVLERWVGAVPERRLIAALRPYLSTSRKQSKNDRFDR